MNYNEYSSKLFKGNKMLDKIEKIANSGRVNNAVSYEIKRIAELHNGKRNPLYGAYEIVSGDGIVINGCEYSQMRQLIKGNTLLEGKKVKGKHSYMRVYGERIAENHPLIIHNDEFYINIIATGEITKRYYHANGVEFSQEELAMVKAWKKPKQGDLDNVVYMLKTPVNTITKIEPKVY